MNTSDEKESISQQPQIEKQMESQVRDLDLHDSYIYFRNYTPNDPITAFVVAKKCVEFGKELLPTSHENPTVLTAITKLHQDACAALVTAVPARRMIKYEFQDFGADRVIPIYKITAKDAGEVQAREEELAKLLPNFVSQQYEQHMHELQKVDNDIFHMLVVHHVVEAKVLTIDEILNEQIKLKMRERQLKLRGETDSIKS